MEYTNSILNLTRVITEYKILFIYRIRQQLMPIPDSAKR